MKNNQRMSNLPTRFKTGYRILMLMSRRKDNRFADKSETVIKRVITSSPLEFDTEYLKLAELKQDGQRIYSSIERRNMKYAIREFKRRQLDNDYNDINTQFNFYKHLKSRFISCLMSPLASDETLFLVDVDKDSQDFDEILSIEKQIIANNLTEVYRYNTKNGYHIILEPFNPAIVTFKVNKNSLLLLAY